MNKYFLTFSAVLSYSLTSPLTHSAPGAPPDWANKTTYNQYVPQNTRAATDDPTDGLVSFNEFKEAITHLINSSYQQGLTDETIKKAAASPCFKSLSYLAGTAFKQPESKRMLEAARTGMKEIPPAYGHTGTYVPNPWHKTSLGELQETMVKNFTDWCVFLPEISGSEDNGLKHIQHFAWFYYQNNAGVNWVQGNDASVPEGLNFLNQFTKDRGYFMAGSGSTTKIQSWIDDPRIEINDYKRTKASQYKSWNDFFTRNIKTNDNQPNAEVLNRTVTMSRNKPSEGATWSHDNINRDYTIVSPTDCIMNPLVQVLEEKATPRRSYLNNPLQENTVLDVKGIPISLVDLLKGVDPTVIKEFVGGTGLSCILMPNTYHHFHSPVSGDVIHAKVVDKGTFGYPDWPNWVPSTGNVGRTGTDFSQFQKFQRGVIIIRVDYCDEKGYDTNTGRCKNTTLTGYVASVPVGLDTIGSVALDDYLKNAHITPVPVIAGNNRFGHFNYGGSLNILLFSKGLASAAVQTRLGSQIGLYRAGTAPK